jgi:tetratricopeptide (TPR) repeat protein
MPRNIARVIPWLVATVGLGLVGVVVARAVRWRPERESRRESPSWEMQKTDADPDLVQALKLQAAGKDQDALVSFDKALARNPTDWFAVAGEANSYEALHRTAEAVASLRKWAELQPRSAAPWIRIATAASRTGDKKLAREAAERATRLDPDLADPYLVLSDLAADDDPAQCVALLEEYLRRVYNSKSLDAPARGRVEQADDGTYIRRLIALHLSRTPEGPARQARAEMDARWYAVQKYADLAPSAARYKRLEHLMGYLRLARSFGDPDRARFAKAQEMLAKLKTDIREGDPLGAGRGDAGVPSTSAP